eukprot:PhM_4_TR18022/c0_g1_i1/m.93173
MWHVVPDGPLLPVPDTMLSLVPIPRRFLPLESRTRRGPHNNNNKYKKSNAPSSTVRIMSWNLHQGSRTALAELTGVVDCYDIIALQEIGSTHAFLRNLPGFELLLTESTYGRSTAILVRAGISPALQQIDIVAPEGITATAVELVLAGTGLIIINVYISPASRVADTRSFLSAAMVIRPDIILGDMNARDMKWCPAAAKDSTLDRKSSEATQRGKILRNFLEHNNWHIVMPDMPTPTHFSPGVRPTTPDVVCVAPHLAVGNIMFRQTPASDHAQLSFELPELAVLRRPQGPAQTSWRRVNQYHESTFRTRLDSLLQRYDPTNTLDHRLYSLVAAVRTAAKSLPRGSFSQPIPAWSKRLSCLRQRALQLAGVGSPDAGKARDEYNTALLEEYDDWIAARPANFWRTAPERKSVLSLSDGTVADSPKSRCAAFAQHFASKHHNPVTPPSFRPRECAPVPEVTPNELDAAISVHPKRKSCDPDGLKAEHLVLLTKRAKAILCDIFTDSLRTGTVPGAWRTARACPTHKPGKPRQDVASYRPIAITVGSGFKVSAMLRYRSNDKASE